LPAWDRRPAIAISRELLYGRWVHAHEEDSEEEMVYRPADSDLPPSRGRRGLERNPDGSYADIRLGPDDRPQRAAGHWDIEGDDQLVVEAEDGASRRTLRVVAADGDAVVVRKPGHE
jgi:hypothetical protein